MPFYANECHSTLTSAIGGGGGGGIPPRYLALPLYIYIYIYIASESSMILSILISVWDTKLTVDNRETQSMNAEVEVVFGYIAALFQMTTKKQEAS